MSALVVVVTVLTLTALGVRAALSTAVSARPRRVPRRQAVSTMRDSEPRYPRRGATPALRRAL